jgi:hypothetical protein
MNQLTAGLIVVIGILGGFYVGAKYGQGHPTAAASTTTTNSTAGTGAGGGGGFGGAGAGGGTGTGAGGGLGAATFGTVTAVNGDTITIHDTRNNRDVQVNIASARITKTADGTPADLTANTAVTIVGQTGSDGVVTATTIAIGNGAGAFGGGGRRGGAPSPSPSTGT